MQGQTCQERCVELQLQLSETQARMMAAEAESVRLKEIIVRMKTEAEQREAYIKQLQQTTNKAGNKSEIRHLQTDFSLQPHPNLPYSHKEILFASARKPKLDSRKRSLSAHSLPQRCGSRTSTKATSTAVQYTPSYGRLVRKVKKQASSRHINTPRKSEVRGCQTARGP